jgi:hypothetical protein
MTIATATAVALCFLGCPGPPPPPAPKPSGPPRDAILTQHNDNFRTGVYSTERALAPASVASRGMALSYWRPVDGGINGQLLYVPALDLGGGRYVDAVFATTTNGTVYAYDANDRGGSGTEQGLIWKQSLLTGDQCNSPSGCVPQNPGGPFGVLSTPVIDRANNTLYVVARWPRGAGGQYGLFALDLRDHRILRNHPIQNEQLNGNPVPFVPTYQGQRPALLLNQGALYIAFGEWGGEGNWEYHGWVLRFDAQSFQLTGAFNPSPNYHCSIGPDHSQCVQLPCCNNDKDCKPGQARCLPGEGAGIWMGGGGLAADDQGYVYALTGNGVADPTTSSFGDSLIKIGPRIGADWGLVDYFTPNDAQMLDNCDLDLGAGAPLVIPNHDRVVGGGKTGKLFVLDRANLRGSPQTVDGGIDAYGNGNVCGFEGGPHLHGSPAYWRSPSAEYVFVWAEQDYLRRFTMTADGSLDPTPVRGDIPGPACDSAQADNLHQMCPMPGGMLSLSGNGRESGILWATVPITSPGRSYFTDPGLPPPGTLYAYNAERMNLLWRADLPPDATGNISRLGKWTPPTIADGKVFVATSPQIGGQSNGRFLVYELGPPPVLQPPVETALLFDDQGRLNVSWLDLGDGYGWHPPQPISDVVARAGDPIAMARQTSTVLTGLFIDKDQKLQVAWLDTTQPPWRHQAISDAVAPAGAHVALAKQTDTVLTGVFFDNQQRFNFVSLDVNHPPWQKPQPISEAPLAPAGAHVALAKQTDTVLTAVFIGNDQKLHVAWRDPSNNPPWRTQAISGVIAPAGAAVALSKQSDTVLTALFVGNDHKLNVAWLDVTHPPWNLPTPISSPIAQPGAHVAVARQTDTVLTALLVGDDHKLYVAWLDVNSPPWHAPLAISDAVLPAGATVAMGKQADRVLTALLVDSDRKLDVAWLDLNDGLGWHPPHPFSGAVAPPGAHVAIERQAP